MLTCKTTPVRWAQILFGALFLLISTSSFAQCEEGEGEITITIYTDDWGYETYWELTAGPDCGVDPVFVGGNEEQVGCDGGGEQDANGDFGYENNSAYTYGPLCITLDQDYYLHYVDDYGDGGFTAEVVIDGSIIATYNGGGNGQVFEFNPGAFEPVPHDQPCDALALTIDGGSAELTNLGATAPVNEVTPGGGNCALQGIWCEGGVSNSVWASFIAPAEGGVFVSTCTAGTEIDTQIALWKGDCSDQSTFELVSANDDILGGCGIANGFASGMYASCLVPGDEYLIQIDGWNGDQGVFFIEVNSYNDTPVLQAFVNDVDCPVDKGEDGTGSIFPYFEGYGSSFEASWTGPNGFQSSDANITGLQGGVYELTATTDCGEVFVADYSIEIPLAFTAAYDIVSPTCAFSGDGGIDLTINGGTQPYTYTWEGPDEYVSDLQDIEGLNEGQYLLTIEDNNGCPFSSPLLTIEATNEVPLDLGPDATLCLDDYLILTAPVGYEYVWQDNSVNQFFEVVAADLGVGTYSYICTASNDEGCEAVDAITITVEECVGVGENAFDALSIYPSPATDQFQLVNIPGQSQVNIYSAQGKLMMSEMTTGSLPVNCSNWTAGVYLIEVTLGTSTWQEKLVVR